MHRPVTLLLGPLSLLAIASVICFLNEPTRLAQGSQDLPILYSGAESCTGCHEQEKDNTKNKRFTLTEYTIWKQNDKHSQAYAVLEKPRSKRMGELLGPDFDPTKEKACLNCHSMEWLDPEKKTEDVKKEDGVTCDGCHGPSSVWLGFHRLPGFWRPKTPEEKSKLGMYDIFSGSTRAKMCVSCHVGNAAEGKILEHRFYAAGHPPLPGIEIDAFCEFMPPHWKPDRWKVRRTENDGEYGRVEMTLVGALTTLGESMTLLSAVSQKPTWPDYAFFDCYSCHHDLRVASWRRARGYGGGKPGRVQPRPWMAPLVTVAVQLLGLDQEAEWKTAQARLRGAFDARPFGDPAQVAAAAGALATWCAKTAKSLEEQAFDQARCLDVLKRLTSLPDADKLDFDSARQVAWAARSILGQLEETGWKPKDAGACAKAIAALEKDLKLELPSGTAKSILGELSGNLAAISEYEESRNLKTGPARFKEQLDALNGAL